MDYYTTAEIAQALSDRAKETAASDPTFAKQLLTAAHFLRLYAAIEYIYRQKLDDELVPIADHLNSLFSKDQTG